MLRKSSDFWFKNRHISYFMLSELTPKILAIGLLPLISRMLSIDEFVTRGFANILVQFGLAFSLFSLNTVYIRGYASRSSDNYDQLPSINLLLFIAVSVIMYVIFPYYSSRFYTPKVLFLPIVAFIFFELLHTYPMIRWRIDSNSKLFFLFVTIKSILQYSGMFLYMYFFRSDIFGYFVGIVFGSSIVSLVFIRPILIPFKKISLSAKDFIGYFRFASPIMLGVILILYSQSFDKFSFSRILEVEQFKFYMFNVGLASALLVFTQGFYKYSESKIFRWSAENSRVEALLIVQKYFTLVGFIGLLTLLLTIYDLIFPVGYSRGKYILAYSFVPVLLSSWFNYKSSIFVARGLPNWAAVSSSFFLLVMLSPLVVFRNDPQSLWVLHCCWTLSAILLDVILVRKLRVRMDWKEFMFYGALFVTPILTEYFLAFASSMSLILLLLIFKKYGRNYSFVFRDISE